MSASIMFHRCINVRVECTYPQNSNSITLEIEYDDGNSKVWLTLYDLPKQITDRFAEFCDEYTYVMKDEKKQEEEEPLVLY